MLGQLHSELSHERIRDRIERAEHHRMVREARRARRAAVDHNGARAVQSDPQPWPVSLLSSTTIAR